MFNFNEEDEYLYFDDIVIINEICDEFEIDEFELEKIVLNFNGDICTYGWDLEYEAISFDDKENGKKCVNYLNGLLILNKLTGD